MLQFLTLFATAAISVALTLAIGEIVIPVHEWLGKGLMAAVAVSVVVSFAKQGWRA